MRIKKFFQKKGKCGNYREKINSENEKEKGTREKAFLFLKETNNFVK